MNAPERFFLPDIQASADHRQQAIDKVGVKGLRYPLALFDAQGRVQHTVAEVSLAVGLPHDVKGTHMSRFVELLEAQKRPALTGERLPRACSTGCSSPGSPPAARSNCLPLLHPQGGAGLRRREPARLRRAAAARKSARARRRRACDDGRGAGHQPVPVLEEDLRLRRAQPALAHHDRGRNCVRDVASRNSLRVAEEEASCEVFGLLKRPDEKWVTERAYDNPKFVEDLVRDIALRLKREPRIAEWTCRQSENFESIHNHSAYAEISGSNGENK
jgi:GTP cyclohydrolase I